MPAPERIRLICSPTPLHRLNHLSEHLGIDLWIKRDDLTGFAGGGNKGRKIEFLIQEAISKGADAVVCQGAVQSNFVRQLGAACAMFGIECHAVVMELPYYAAAGKPEGKELVSGGNVVLDTLFGVKLHLVPDGDWDELDARTEDMVERLQAIGKKVYKVATGGSSALGAYSFVLAGQEIDASGARFDYVVTPSSSGSTHAGLAYQFLGSETHVIGINADPDPEDELAHNIVELCAEVDEMLGLTKGLSRRDIDLRMEFCGEAYGIPSAEGNRAIEVFARREGIILDPVYTGKAAAGLLELVARKELSGRVLFWHTGGLPTLFAH